MTEILNIHFFLSLYNIYVDLYSLFQQFVYLYVIYLVYMRFIYLVDFPINFQYN